MSRYITFNMTDCDDYDDVTIGVHSLKLKAKATDYQDSNFSIPVEYTKINYFCIENIDDTLSTNISLTVDTTYYSMPDLEYSYDKISWTQWVANTTIPLNAKQKVYLRGNNTTFSSSASADRHTFSSSGSALINLLGDIATLYDKTGKTKDIGGAGKDYFFYRLFYQWTNLHSVKDLILSPAKIAERCYQEMFMGCTSLIDTPVILVEIAKNSSMQNMFTSCSNLRTLTNNPIGLLSEIPHSCCINMFASCVELTQLPKFNATTYGDSACERMFSGCSKIYISTTQSIVYPNAFRIPADGTGTFGSSAIYGIIQNTGGTAYSIVKETTYYSANEIIE